MNTGPCPPICSPPTPSSTTPFMVLLRQHGVVSVEAQGGKRALRMYPPWDCTTNRQAQTHAITWGSV